MPFQYTPYTLPVFSAALAAIGLLIVVWRRRPAPALVPFAVMTVGLIEWSLGYALHLSATNYWVKYAAMQSEYIGITIVPAAWLVVAMEFTGHEKWIKPRLIGLLTIMPVLTVLVAATNQLHHFFWSSVESVEMYGFLLLSTNYSQGFWIHAVYSYALLVAGMVLLVQYYFTTTGLYRRQTAALILSGLIPWVGNALTIFSLTPFPQLDLTPLSFTIMCAIVAYNLFRYRLMDVVPIARNQVFESIRDAVFVFDSQHRLVDINPAALELTGKMASSAVIGSQAASVLPALGPLVESPRLVPELVIGEDELSRHFQVTRSEITNQRGTVTGTLFVLHEITDIKVATDQIMMQNNILVKTNFDLADAQHKAEEANRLKSEFLATMSHELRTPLNAIIGFSDMMLQGLTGKLSDKQGDYLGRVVSNGERLLSLINDVLDLSKIEARRVDILNEPFVPADLLNGIDRQLHGLADSKGLQFVTSLDPQMPAKIIGDARRLEQVLVNLVGNAVRFTEKGSVKVNFTCLDSAQWMLTVEDTGIGIPAHALEFIFDEFRQVDGSSTRMHGGTGLGLAIVRKLVTLMGGTISVESEVGKGSKFIVRLPLITESQATQA